MGFPEKISIVYNFLTDCLMRRLTSVLIRLSRIPIFVASITGIALFALIWVIYWIFPVGKDFANILRPAALAFIARKSPYINGFYNPPWALIPLVPLLPLPPKIASVILSTVNAISFGFVAYRLGAKPLALALIVFSPPVIYGVLDPNFDWLVALGLILPPQIGLFFILVKPQLGSILAIFWFVQAWKQDGYRQVIKVFSPVIIVFLISLILYGFWPLQSSDLYEVRWNASLWPASIPIGLVLAVSAIRKLSKRSAIIASPFLSPYVAAYSLSIPVLGLLPAQLETITAVIGLWVFQFLWGGPL
jgi:hypothetical protein